MHDVYIYKQDLKMLLNKEKSKLNWNKKFKLCKKGTMQSVHLGSTKKNIKRHCVFGFNADWLAIATLGKNRKKLL